MKGLLEKKANPQDQEQYDIFVTNGMLIIHNSKTSQALIEQIVKSQDPVEAVANATISVVKKLEESAAANKIKIKDGTLMHGGNALMGEIISVAEAAGMNPLTDEQKQQSYSLAVSKYLKGAIESGKITPEQLKQMGQEVSQTPEGQKIAQQMEMPQERMGGVV